MVRPTIVDQLHMSSNWSSTIYKTELFPPELQQSGGNAELTPAITKEWFED